MRWNIPDGCEYGAELKNPKHLLHQGILLAQGLPAFLTFISLAFPGLPSDLFNCKDLTFNPTVELVGELGRFLWE